MVVRVDTFPHVKVADVKTQDVVNSLTSIKPTYWYALINGRLFKCHATTGIDQHIFMSKDALIGAIKYSLYSCTDLIPETRYCEYNEDAFFDELQKNTNIEFKTIEF